MFGEDQRRQKNNLTALSGNLKQMSRLNLQDLPIGTGAGLYTQRRVFKLVFAPFVVQPDQLLLDGSDARSYHYDQTVLRQRHGFKALPQERSDATTLNLQKKNFTTATCFQISNALLFRGKLLRWGMLQV